MAARRSRRQSGSPAPEEALRIPPNPDASYDEYPAGAKEVGFWSLVLSPINAVLLLLVWLLVDPTTVLNDSAPLLLLVAAVAMSLSGAFSGALGIYHGSTNRKLGIPGFILNLAILCAYGYWFRNVT